jgi:hypothetical protein
MCINVFDNIENELKHIKHLKQITDQYILFWLPILLNNKSANYCDGYIFIVILDNTTRGLMTLRCELHCI